MKIIRYNNPPVTQTTTTLGSDVGFNSNEIEVLLAASFNTNDYVLIEDVGNELCEIVQITNKNNNTLSITPTTLPHKSGASVTKLNYNKFKIEKSSSLDDEFEDLDEIDIDYSNPHNILYYIDESNNASDKLYYKIYYKNSENAVEDLQATLNREKNYGYIDVETFRLETGFTQSEVSDSEIERAIYHSVEWIQDNAYVYHEFNGNKDNNFIINTELEFADFNGDSLIDKNDFLVYEFNPTTLVKTYLNHKIIKILPNSKRIYFNSTVPSNPNNQLILKIPLTFRKLDTIKSSLATISKLIATNWLLRNVDTSRIKGGVTSWNAGGTSVSRDLSTLRQSLEGNLNDARRILTQVCKIYIKQTKLRTERSSLNQRQRYMSGYTSVSRRF